jgi:uncharacterized delta-60 repeat protein
MKAGQGGGFVPGSAHRRFGGAAAIGVAFAVYALVTFGAGVALGGPADVDSAFGVGGVGEVGVPGTVAFAADAALQTNPGPDNDKIVVAGTVDGDLAVVRFNAEGPAAGTVDTTFSTDGVATADFGANGFSLQRNVLASAVAFDSLGNVVVAGTEHDRTPDEDDDIALARFTPAGILDASFGVSGKLTTDIHPFGEGSPTQGAGSRDEAGDVAVLASGKILVGGGSVVPTTSGNTARIAFVRYNADGTPDNNFSGDGQALADVPTTISPTSPMIVERMVVSATTITAAIGRPRATGAGTYDDFAAARFKLDGATDPEDGQPDNTFDTDGFTKIDLGSSDDGATSLALDGTKIVLAGGTSVDRSGGSHSDFALARLNGDGTLDSSFAGDGTLTTTFGDTGFAGSVANDVAVQGTQIVAGGFSDACGGRAFALARYNSDGSPDSTFSGDGRAIAGLQGGRAEAVLLPAANKIVLAGSAFASPDDIFAVAQYGTPTPDSGAAYCPTMLTVSLAGSGSGTVTGDGINCPGDCTDGGDPGRTSNFLTATPATGSTFTGWSDPDCALDPDDEFDVLEECSVSVGTDTHVTATFAGGGTTTTTTTTTTPTTTTPATDTTPPETTIVKGPKKKTPKSKAKLTFTSSEPGSTFECALSGKKVKKKLKKFLPCSSPTKYKKLKTGKKKFQVRATDPAGNPDSTPAAKKWKVKPKKK